MKKPTHIGFIFLDEIHHIFHFIGIAIELSKKNKVSILTYQGDHTFLRTELKRLGGKNVEIEALSTHFFRAFTDKLKKRNTPRVGFWMNKNKQYILHKFDLLVFSSYIHHKFLKSRKGNLPLFVSVQHGTPGRAYAFNPDELDFDAQLLLGEYHFNQFKALNILGKRPILIGYPKLDAVQSTSKINFFKNNNPVIIYSPHFSRNFTSWHKMGINVLEYFYNQKEYNLIFAPHIQLFNALGGASIADFPNKYLTCSHFHIDFGSKNSVDMSYTKSADIFIGDVSSQVYEFIIKPRPCLFLNAHNFDFKEDSNFRFWKCGEVIDSISDLNEALKYALEKFKTTFKPIQEKITSENYYSKEGFTASELAANAIETILSETN